MRYPSHDVQLDGGDLGVSARATWCADGQVGENPGRARRQQEQAVAETNRVVYVMGHQQRYHGTVVHQDGNLIAQTGGEGGIERSQRFVENEERRLDGERTGERHAPGQTQR
jgi:hypothetical protein